MKSRQKHILTAVLCAVVFLLRFRQAFVPNAEPFVAAIAGMMAACLAGCVLQIGFAVCARLRRK